MSTTGIGEAADETTRTPAAAPNDMDDRSDHSSLKLWRRWGLSLARFDLTGVFCATFFLCWSLTPSLLPRGWLFQGIIGGVNAALGYAVGFVIGWAARRYGLAGRPWWPPPRRWLRAVRVAVITVCAAATVGMLLASAQWQRDLAALMDAQGATTTGYIRAGLVTVGVVAAIVTVFRLLRDGAVWAGALLARYTRFRRRVTVPMGSIAVLGLTVVVLGEAVLPAVEGVGDHFFSAVNGETPDDAVRPARPERSGAPQSAVPWGTLGYEGRVFVSGGWHAARIADGTGAPAREPIRLYVGLDSAPTPEARMALLREEIARTHAFDRAAVVVVATTGTGWVDPAAADAIELMYGGDTAIIAAQYSYRPSVVSYLTHRGTAQRAGTLLIDTVRDAYVRTTGMQPGTGHASSDAERPQLYVFGESLGVIAGQAAFDSLADVRRSVDGALWVGPPHSGRLWRSIVTRRDAGTREVDPTYANGLVVRFATSADDLRRKRRRDAPWLHPRVLYIQHPSDPVVWWTTDLLFHRPDWLSEVPGADRLTAMRWFPLVTFWQVSADLAMAGHVPAGHGHRYGTQVLDGWAAVAAPPGWTEADTRRTRALVEREREE